MLRSMLALSSFLLTCHAKPESYLGLLNLVNNSDENMEPRQAAQCGQSSFAEEKIVNGQQSASHRWPWMVNILFFGTVHVCGGSLLDETHVVSAAHCFPKEIGLRTYMLVLGDHSQTDHEPGQVISFDIQKYSNSSDKAAVYPPVN